MKPHRMQRIAVEDRSDLLLSKDEWDIRPLGDLVMVQEFESSKMAGGIHIPEKAQDGFWSRWKVLAVGPGRVTTAGERVPLQVNVGDLVCLQKTSAIDVPGRSGTMLVPEQAIIAVVTKKEPTE